MWPARQIVQLDYNNVKIGPNFGLKNYQNKQFNETCPIATFLFEKYMILREKYLSWYEKTGQF
jgi:hypothetical protein